MYPLLRIVILLPIAYVIALVSAAVVVNVGMFGREFFDADVIPFALGGIIGVTFYGGMISFLPALVIVVAAEILRWRSLIFWLAAGGVVGIFASEVTRSWDGLNFLDNLFTLCLAAGFVGGFVYWLIAGRDSGPAISADPAARTDGG